MSDPPPPSDDDASGDAPQASSESGSTSDRLRGLSAALGTVLTVALVLAALAAWGFAELTDEVLEGALQTDDRAILLWIDGHAAPWVDAVALEVTALGNTAVLALVVLLTSSFLWLRDRRKAVALLWIGSVGTALLNPLLKSLVGRPRPRVVEWGTEVASLSFPSGHAMNSMVIYSLVAYLLATTGAGGPASAAPEAVPETAPEAPTSATSRPSRRFRATVAVVAAVLVLAIGLSRVALGVHFATDVLGGFAAGFVWAVATAAVIRLMERPPRARAATSTAGESPPGGYSDS